ncbi:mitochondrial genome maintenance exonuclease 1 isoform X2 [Bombus terrestris]|uniref:Mitochondrial genome maintenance exonuclease 1 n=1 Tax=Bombus terrestris TaxID=30195 RepID=A0A9C6W7M6_BOMTE|nr:mitochondrial genome maintenance exonuclease 1 isoform X2 [Bombus terrestris]
MLRLSILQSVNGVVLKLNINENRFLIKCMSDSKKSNRTIKREDTSKLQDTTDSDIDGDVHKQINNMEATLQKKRRVESCEIQHIEDNEDLKIPTVTHVLSETISPKVKTALEWWKKDMIGICGEEYFKTYCKGILNNNKLFHSYAQMMFPKEGTKIPPFIKPIYFSVKPILDKIQIFDKTQTTVIHPTLRYKSIVDCIASFSGHTYLIYWKRSTTRKTSLAATHDTPIQVAAHIGAINASNEYSSKIDKGLVIVAYTSGEPASIHELKGDALQTAWREWLSRLEQFHANYKER